MADDVVREPERALEVVEARCPGDEFEHDVEALVLVVDLVGEATPTPPVGLLDVAGAEGDLLLDLLDHGLHAGVVEVAVDDDHEFVGSHREHTSLWTRRRRGPADAEQGSIGPVQPSGLEPMITMR